MTMQHFFFSISEKQQLHCMVTKTGIVILFCRERRTTAAAEPTFGSWE
jgi:hypothetical protein